jgi:hypothetical protein
MAPIVFVIVCEIGSVGKIGRSDTRLLFFEPVLDDAIEG